MINYVDEFFLTQCNYKFIVLLIPVHKLSQKIILMYSKPKPFSMHLIRTNYAVPIYH